MPEGRCNKNETEKRVKEKCKSCGICYPRRKRDE